MNVGAVSYLFAFFAYLILTILLVFSWRGRIQGLWIVLAGITSTIWAGLIGASELGVSLSAEILQLSELVRSSLWCMFLLAALDEATDEDTKHTEFFKWMLGFAAIVFVLFIVPGFAEYILLPDILFKDSLLVRCIAVAIALLGIVLIEQIFRKSRDSQQWAARFLCLGIGCIFVYDFFMYTDTLLFKRISFNLWEARGIVNGIAAPLIAVALIRHPKRELDIHVSRDMVFHTAIVIGVGSYLLLMAVIGSFIGYYGGVWGSLLQIVFLFSASILLLIFLFSDKIRVKIRIFLSKHFFSYQHDYREEWLRFTKNLAGSVDSVPERIIQSIITLTKSDGGVLWEKTASGQYLLTTRWHMPEVINVNASSLSSLVLFMERTQWVINFDEYEVRPELYENLIIPEWLLSIPNAWFVVPLIFRGECLGFVLVKRSDLQKTMNWEDWDLLKTGGQQAASLLAQYQADQALVQSRQFEAFNRLSAYIVHDLKNILAQQSLIVTNAEKHKQNPEFIDDVIETIKNSVARMKGLMAQMRSGERGGSAKRVNLNEVLKTVVNNAVRGEPRAEYNEVDEPVYVIADEEQLTTVFGHVIHNAQDATDRDGRVSVSLKREVDHVVVEVEDTGIGMEPDFVRDRLFKPFDSTKGLVGMGVGAFESREYIRSLGGDISVNSLPGEGSTFCILLPCESSGEEINHSKDVRGVGFEGTQ